MKHFYDVQAVGDAQSEYEHWEHARKVYSDMIDVFDEVGLDCEELWELHNEAEDKAASALARFQLLDEGDWEDENELH